MVTGTLFSVRMAGRELARGWGTLVRESLYRGSIAAGSLFRGEFVRGEYAGGLLPRGRGVSSREVGLEPAALQQFKTFPSLLQFETFL